MENVKASLLVLVSTTIVLLSLTMLPIIGLPNYSSDHTARSTTQNASLPPNTSSQPYASGIHPHGQGFGQPLTTPIVGSDGSLRFPSSTQNHWWLLDFWDSSPSGGNMPSLMTGEFTAVANHISGLDCFGCTPYDDAILYLPLNVAYGTSSNNCVWFQFDVQFSPSGQIYWYIWDINCPGTNLNPWPNGDYHSTSIGLPYVVGDQYSFAITTSGSSSVTFSISNTSTGSSWSKSDWVWTVPSTTLLATEGTFSPSSAVEGYTTASSLTGVTLFPSKIGDGITTNRNYESGTGVPSGIATSRSSLGDSSHWTWSMSALACGPVSTADKLNCSGLSPTTIGLNWGQSGYLFFNRYELQQSTSGSSGPWTTIDTIASKSNTTDYVRNLSPSTTYWWRIIDYDCCGGTATSNVLQIIQPASASLTFTKPTETTVRFAWNNPATYGGLLAFSSYQIMESINGGSYSLAQAIYDNLTRSWTTNLSPGDYGFYLITTDECGSCSTPSLSSSNSNTVSIIIPLPPNASASAQQATVDVGQVVSLTCSVTGGVPPYTYSWDFGDGFLGSGQTVTHVYSSRGVMNPACTVTDFEGAIARSSTSVIVSSDPSLTTPVGQPASADVGQTVVFTTQVVGGSGGYTYSWLGLPTGCSSANTAVISCIPTGTGIFTIKATVSDSNGFPATSNGLQFTVNSALMITPPVIQPSLVDVGQSVMLTTSASGGSGGYVYTWLGLPLGCNSVDLSTFSCSPSAGTFHITVSVTDSNGFTVTSSPLSLAVNPDPMIATFTVSPASIDLGQTVTLITSAAGGTGTLSFSYSGLPSGCAGSDATVIACAPGSTGTYQVTVTATDSSGFTVTSTQVTFTVNPDPTVTSFRDSAPVIDLGDSLTLRVSVTGGTGKVTYSYSGLPLGCISANTASLTCTPSSSGIYTIEVTVTDQAGRSSASSANLEVGPARVIGLPSTEGYAVIGGVIVAAIVLIVLALVLIRRGNRPHGDSRPGALLHPSGQ